MMKCGHCWRCLPTAGRKLAPKFASLRLITLRTFGRRLAISKLWKVCSLMLCAVVTLAKIPDVR